MDTNSLKKIFRTIAFALILFCMICAVSILTNQDNFGILTFTFFTYPYLNEITPIALVAISILALIIARIDKKIMIDLIEVIIVLSFGIVLFTVKILNSSLLLYAYIFAFIIYVIYLIVKLNRSKAKETE